MLKEEPEPNRPVSHTTLLGSPTYLQSPSPPTTKSTSSHGWNGAGIWCFQMWLCWYESLQGLFSSFFHIMQERDICGTQTVPVQNGCVYIIHASFSSIKNKTKQFNYNHSSWRICRPTGDGLSPALCQAGWASWPTMGSTVRIWFEPTIKEGRKIQLQKEGYINQPINAIF